MYRNIHRMCHPTEKKCTFHAQEVACASIQLVFFLRVYRGDQLPKQLSQGHTPENNEVATSIAAVLQAIFFWCQQLVFSVFQNKNDERGKTCKTSLMSSRETPSNMNPLPHTYSCPGPLSKEQGNFASLWPWQWHVFARRQASNVLRLPWSPLLVRFRLWVHVSQPKIAPMKHVGHRGTKKAWSPLEVV